MQWQAVGDGVFVRRHPSYDLNVGLVVGDGACLVIDTRESLRAGRELADAVRMITAAPWTVVNTHAHFDHFLGNAAFVPCDIWALERCRTAIADTGDAQLRQYGDGATPLTPPTHTFAPPAHLLDVGGRGVELRYLGRGHTDNDVVVAVDEVVFAGDLVEEGGPPMFDDAFPAEWPDTVAALWALVQGPVVPGHGAVVDAAFVRAQEQLLRQVAHLDREQAAAKVRELLS